MKRPVEAPQPGAAGSSRASMLQWVRNKNNQAENWKKKRIAAHTKKFTFNVMRMEEERLDWHAFLKQLKVCNSDDLSEFAGLVRDKLHIDDDDGEAQMRHKKRTRFRDLFTDEELGIKVKTPTLQRSLTLPNLRNLPKKDPNILLERYHTDVALHAGHMEPLIEEDENVSRPGTRDNLPKAGIITNIVDDNAENNTLPKLNTIHETKHNGHSANQNRPRAATKTRDKHQYQSLPNLFNSEGNMTTEGLSTFLTLGGADESETTTSAMTSQNKQNQRDSDIPHIKTHRRSKKKREHHKNKVPLEDRISEFCKKIDDFAKADRPTDFMLPPIMV